MKRLLKMLWKEYKIHLIIVFLCIIAVSYTHLDVYKRQL